MMVVQMNRVIGHGEHSAAHGRDEGLAKLEKINATRPKLPRFDTSGKAFLHNQDLSGSLRLQARRQSAEHRDRDGIICKELQNPAIAISCRSELAALEAPCCLPVSSSASRIIMPRMAFACCGPRRAVIVMS